VSPSRAVAEPWDRADADAGVDSRSATTAIGIREVDPRAGMPTCQNCESFVTERYVKVFEPEGIASPRACPHCEDMVRRGKEVRAKKN